MKYAEYVIKYAKYVMSTEYDMCSRKYAKYAIKYAKYAKYVILKKICRICTPHFADGRGCSPPASHEPESEPGLEPAGGPGLRLRLLVPGASGPGPGLVRVPVQAPEARVQLGKPLFQVSAAARPRAPRRRRRAAMKPPGPVTLPGGPAASPGPQPTLPVTRTRTSGAASESDDPAPPGSSRALALSPAPRSLSSGRESEYEEEAAVIRMSELRCQRPPRPRGGSGGSGQHPPCHAITVPVRRASILPGALPQTCSESKGLSFNSNRQRHTHTS
jgi:hypothetical protein